MRCITIKKKKEKEIYVAMLNRMVTGKITTTKQKISLLIKYILLKVRFMAFSTCFVSFFCSCCLYFSHYFSFYLFLEGDAENRTHTHISCVCLNLCLPNPFFSVSFYSNWIFFSLFFFFNVKMLNKSMLK